MDDICRIRIPDFEKERGMIWVEYPVCEDVWWGVYAIVELKVQQEWN
ncbi:hypothetical protein LCGC14_2358390 [marine sediment metagenome]|uniref:Uncharacterized protein n=1 Tax=marine sediment metagenome TaxID=412755 RepID=A0A0F9F264_9ZZZZ